MTENDHRKVNASTELELFTTIHLSDWAELRIMFFTGEVQLWIRGESVASLTKADILRWARGFAVAKFTVWDSEQ